MKRALVLFACAAMSAVLTAQQPAAAKVTAASFIGTWNVTSVNGEAAPPLQFVVDKDGYSVVVNGQVVERGGIKFDVAKTPMTVDLAITEGDDAGKSQVGIVELSGDTIRMQLNAPAATARPTTFDIQEGFFLFTGERQKTRARP
ncbi:MAG: TIGR03067 domain-containing protein [Acidobacteriota bacterium]|nr:TIGR03067 domain-containing protein [Acidobacteriota bacterium]